MYGRWLVMLGLLFLPVAPAAVAAGTLAGSEWRPEMLGEQAVPADAGLFVQFGGEGKLTGHGGCNRFFGSYEVSGQRLRIGPLGATRMACPESVMDLEAAFLAALERTASYRRDRIELQLFDDAGAELADLRQTDWD